MRVAFAGTPEFALPALAALSEHHQLLGVLTQPDRPRGRGRRLGASPVKQAALARGLPLDQPETLRTEAGRAQLTAWAPEALVVVAYGLVLPRSVLELPRYGCLNIHASLLPRWRGAAPIQRAILAGDAQTGITVMQMDAGLDTGAMLVRRAVAISASDTAGAVHDELAHVGAQGLLEALEGLAAGTLRPEPQPPEGVTYAAKIDKAEALIDWAQDADAIERRIRAFNPWPIAETRLAGEQLRIHAARPSTPEDLSPGNVPLNFDKTRDPGAIIAVNGDYMLVNCGRGTLAVTQVQQPGKKPVSVRAFAQGRPLAGRTLG